MTEHDLLIRHATNWANSRKLPLDRDLLETVLSLRDFHDEQRPQAWPAGSAEHLMLVRWPSHGPSEVPAPDVLLGTLETFWRFLRGSGRMAAGSAEPKTLVKEAKRAAPRMAEACADPARHSATKSILEFGESIGISVEGAASEEELQQRLDQVMGAWNALPVEERRRLSPGETAHQGSRVGERATSLVQALAMGAFDHDGAAPYEGFVDEEELDDTPMPRKDPAVVAREVQRSPFVQHVLQLANWVGGGRAVTATRVLRLAEARAAFTDLRLGEWESRRHGERPGDVPAGPRAQVHDEELSGVRSSADVHSLDRLWSVAAQTGLIEIGRTKASSAEVSRRNDEAWTLLGVMALTSLYMYQPSWWGQRRVVFGAALMLLAHGSVEVGELQEWWWGHERNPLGPTRIPSEDETESSYLRWLSDRTVTAALAEFSDTGAWRRAGSVLDQTDLGYEWALILAHLEERGMLDDEE